MQKCVTRESRERLASYIQACSFQIQAQKRWIVEMANSFLASGDNNTAASFRGAKNHLRFYSALPTAPSAPPAEEFLHQNDEGVQSMLRESWVH